MAQTFIRGTQLRTGTVPGAALVSGSITTTQIAATTIVDGNIAAAAAIATSKLADGATFVRSNGSVSMAAALNMGSNLISGLAAPVSATDAATKQYVDQSLAGWKDAKESCRVATTANLASTYSAGVLTASANGAITIDTIALALNDRVLVKDQSTATQNGIYYVSQVGDASNPFKLTRASDFVQGSATSGAFCFVTDGSTNLDTGWMLSTKDSITVDTSTITWIQFSSAVAVTSTSLAGNGLVPNGAAIDINPGNGISLASDKILVKNDTAGPIVVTASGVGITTGNGLNTGTTLSVKNDSTGPITVTASGVGITTGNGLNTGTTLSVKVDTAGPITVSASGVNFSAGNGLTNGTSVVVKPDSAGAVGVTASGVAVLVDTTKGVQISSNKVATKIDASTIVYDGSGNLSVSSSAAMLVSKIKRDIFSGNGSTTTFTLTGTPLTNTDEIFFNGSVLIPGAGNDYTISGTTLTLLFTPATNDVILAYYVTA